jgi:acyl-CoA thioester hydrolase
LLPPGVFKLRRRVEWRDIDTAQHVNNAAYINYIEDCGMQAAITHGWPLDRTQTAGFAVIVRQHQIEYRQAAVLNDELELATWVSDVKRVSAARHYTIHRATDGELLVQARTLWVWVDLHTGGPIRIPDAYRADFAPNPVTEQRSKS